MLSPRWSLLSSVKEVRVHLKCSKAQFIRETCKWVCEISFLLSTFYEPSPHNEHRSLPVPFDFKTTPVLDIPAVQGRVRYVCWFACVCACIWMYVYNLTDPDSCLIVDGFFPPNTGSVWKPPPPFPASHAAAFLTLLPCFPFSLHTSAIFHFPLWEIVCVCERVRLIQGQDVLGLCPGQKDTWV